jgi:hypothetical protein
MLMAGSDIFFYYQSTNAVTRRRAGFAEQHHEPYLAKGRVCAGVAVEFWTGGRRPKRGQKNGARRGK